MSDQRKRRVNSAGKCRPNSTSDNRKNDRETVIGTNSASSRTKISPSSSNYKSNFQRTNSYDKVRTLVEKEGRIARNLVVWNVPFEDSDDSDGQAKSRSPRKFKPRSRTTSLGTQRKATKSSRDSASGRSRAVVKPGSPVKPAKKIDLRARYWAFLFDNLERAVDEIYQTCEVDESIVECKEVIMMLTNCTRDFDSLIERIRLQTAFEKADAENRPTSLAWEVRKSSPGKSLVAGSSGDRGSPSPVNRSLNFSSQGTTKPGVSFNSQSGGLSWADKVKGSVTVKSSVETQDKEIVGNQGQIAKEVEDGDGWETVQRKEKGKQNKCRQLQQSSPKQWESFNSGNREYLKNHVSNTEPSRSVSYEGRTRVDSEKENQPIKNTEDLSVRVVKSMGELEKQLKSSLKLEILTTEENSLKKTNLVDSKDENAHGVEKLVECSPPKEGTEHVVTSDNEMKQEDDELASQLQSAMVAVLDEEETLTTQLEKCQEEAMASAIEEEEKLFKEIEEEENKEIVVETENEEESDLGNTMSSLELSQKTLDWGDIIDQYDKRETSSWGDIVESTERSPGHALHMHEKLSSPSRKRTRAESQRIHEEKQAKAQQLREKLQEEKAHKLRMLNERINEVRAWKNVIHQQQKKEMEDKLHKAEEKRTLQLQAVIKKAQEEEAKVNEIAFINTLEAQNKRHEILTRYELNEARLQDIVEERQRRQEEKAAKEEAAQERRRALEEERLAKLEAMQRHRKDQESKITEIKSQRDMAREETAKSKAREREIRLAALDAAQKAKEEEIQKKIQQKHDQSTKRHTKLIEERREKAMELSTLRNFATTDIVPQQTPYEKKKFCSVCSVLISSEVYLLSHLHGKKHKQTIQDSLQGKTMSEEEMENHSWKQIINAPEARSDPQMVAEKERQKTFRKRARKIRQRMSSKGKDYDNNLHQCKPLGSDSENRAKLQKAVKDINKYLQTQGSGPWPVNRVSALDRAVGEISRILDKKVQADQLALQSCGGLTALSRIMLVIGESTEVKPLVIPTKSLCNAANVLKLACRNCFENCQYMLYGNKMGPMVDMLMHRLNFLLGGEKSEQTTSSSSSSTHSESAKLPIDLVATGLMQLISTVLHCLAKNITLSSKTTSPKSTSKSVGATRCASKLDVLQQWGTDIVSYLVSVGVLDQLTLYFNSVHGPVDEDPKSADFIQHCLGLLVAMTRFIMTKSCNVFDESKRDDPTQLLITLKFTEFAGIVSMLYGILLHGGAPARKSNFIPPELPEHTLNVVSTGLKMLNTFAVIDLKMLQGVLGQEGISLEFRHIATYLLWYCSNWRKNEDLVHEVILLVGYFTVLNPDNQLIVQLGNTPTLLQQLCSLPFQYFSDPRLMNILFPALIACCYGNVATKKILEQEMSCSLLATYIEEKTREKEKLKLLPSVAKTKDKEKDKDGLSRMMLESQISRNMVGSCQEVL
ncbi:S phase cyclin A-associated protein in the endoplasmic reticulum-like [Saccoglossus kowalevskii]